MDHDKNSINSHSSNGYGETSPSYSLYSCLGKNKAGFNYHRLRVTNRLKPNKNLTLNIMTCRWCNVIIVRSITCVKRNDEIIPIVSERVVESVEPAEFDKILESP